MTTRMSHSELKLGELACAVIRGRKKPRVLIGGLGMGFTLRAVLSELGGDAEVTVVELMPEIITWNRNPAYPLGAEPLNDTRVRLVEGDVFDEIGQALDAYDSIVLDVDNGPEALTLVSNGRLYGTDGLALIYGALRPGGCLAVWSVADKPAFSEALIRQGFVVEVKRVPVHESSGGIRTIFLGTKPGRR